VGWGVPKEKALKYETHVKGGKFLVVVRGEPGVVARAHAMLADQSSGDFDRYDPSAS
jgi:hypothetical protein